MEVEQRKIVFGYVRLNYGDINPVDIIDIIYSFYLIKIASNILDTKEQFALMNLLFDRMKKEKEYKDLKSVNAELLFRASEHDFNGEKFQELCNGKAPHLLIIHSEHNHVFGGFVSNSWDKRYDDEKAFLYVIRPTQQIFELKEGERKGKEITWKFSDYGPIIGRGADIWICNECHLDKNRRNTGCQNNENTSFDFDPKVLCGVEKNGHFDDSQFVVTEYEVFHLDMQ